MSAARAWSSGTRWWAAGAWYGAGGQGPGPARRELLNTIRRKVGDIYIKKLRLASVLKDALSNICQRMVAGRPGR